MENKCRGPKCCREVHIKKRGLCAAHNLQRHLGKNLTPLPEVEESERCPVPWCSREAMVKGLCPAHASVCWRMSLNPDDYVRAISDMTCSVCSKKNTKLAIDHDHACCPGNYSCGTCIRGVVCAQCNNFISSYEAIIRQSHRIPDYCANPPTLERHPYRPTGKDDRHPGRNKRG